MLTKAKLLVTAYLSMYNRLDRRRFIKGILAAVLLSLLYSILSALFETLFHSPSASFSQRAFSLNYLDPFILLIPFVLSIGRLYDLNRGKKWLILYAIPGINIIFFLCLLLCPGSKTANDYGIPTAAISDTELAEHARSFANSKTARFDSLFTNWQGCINRNGFFWQMLIINLVGFCCLSILFVIILMSGINFPSLSLDELAAFSEADYANLFTQITVDSDIIVITLLLFAGILFLTNGLMLSSMICLSVRRWHDFGKSGWYAAYSKIPSYIIAWLFSISDNDLWLYYNLALFLFLVVYPGRQQVTTPQQLN